MCVHVCICVVNVCFISTEQRQQSRGSPTLQDVMVFLTGCDSVPPLGFGDSTSSIHFSESGEWPTASTCALSLTFPLNFPTDTELFKEKMDFSILGSQGFFGQL